MSILWYCIQYNGKCTVYYSISCMYQVVFIYWCNYKFVYEVVFLLMQLFVCLFMYRIYIGHIYSWNITIYMTKISCKQVKSWIKVPYLLMQFSSCIYWIKVIYWFSCLFIYLCMFAPLFVCLFMSVRTVSIYTLYRAYSLNTIYMTNRPSEKLNTKTNSKNNNKSQTNKPKQQQQTHLAFLQGVCLMNEVRNYTEVI